MSHKTKNAPEPAATGIEGSSNSTQQMRGTLVKIISNPPTSAEVAASFESRNAGKWTTLAETSSGTFTATIERYDFLDGDEVCVGGTEIHIDNAEQDGGESWHDLTVLKHQAKNFAKIAVEMIAASAAQDAIKVQRDPGAWIGDWFPAGTTGTPPLESNGGERDTHCVTLWQENSKDGSHTEPTVLIDCDGDLTPEAALEFAVHLAEEAGRALRIAADLQNGGE